MPVELRVEGAEQLERVARRLRETGDTDLRRDLYRGIQRATKPLRDRARQAARVQLPSQGGLNEWVASARFSTKTRGGGRTPGVRITATKAGHDLKSLDRGELRHPVFGNRQVWVSQRIRPGWFTKTMESGAPEVRRALVDVLDHIGRRIARR